LKKKGSLKSHSFSQSTTSPASFNSFGNGIIFTAKRWVPCKSEAGYSPNTFFTHLFSSFLRLITLWPGSPNLAPTEVPSRFRPACLFFFFGLTSWFLFSQGSGFLSFALTLLYDPGLFSCPPPNPSTRSLRHHLLIATLRPGIVLPFLLPNTSPLALFHVELLGAPPKPPSF